MVEEGDGLLARGELARVAHQALPVPMAEAEIDSGEVAVLCVSIADADERVGGTGLQSMTDEVLNL